MHLKQLTFLFCLLFSLQFAFGQERNTDYWYSISNKSQGKEYVLALKPGSKSEVILTSKPDRNSQYWKLTHIGSGFYRLTNRALGNSKSLDVHPKRPHALAMVATGNFSGQFWKFQDSDAFKNGVRLSNQKLKSKRSLMYKSAEGGQLVMTKLSDKAAQNWSLRVMGKITGDDKLEPITNQKFKKLNAQKKNVSDR